MNISIIILNWNGVELLKECLPSVISAMREYSGDYEIIMVDNASTDGSIEYIESSFPQVCIFPMRQNLGFAKALNIGIEKAKYPAVVCLNNDIIVENKFFEPLLRHLHKEDVFAVGPKILLTDKKTLNFGKAIGSFKYGFFTRKIYDSLHSVNSLYACAGGMVFKKDKFLELGGFDEDMDVYWEDLDLCYRAWRRGWRTVYEPQGIIYHKFHATNIHKYGSAGIDFLSGRNYSLFVVKNIHNKFLFIKHLLFLPFLIILSFIFGKGWFALGIIKSFGKFDVFMTKRRIEESKPSVLSDRHIIGISRQ